MVFLFVPIQEVRPHPSKDGFTIIFLQRTLINQHCKYMTFSAKTRKITLRNFRFIDTSKVVKVVLIKK